MKGLTPKTKIYMASWLSQIISYNPYHAEFGIGSVYVRDSNLPRGESGPFCKVRFMDWRIV